MHEVLVNRLGGLSLPRKSVVRLTDRPDMTLDVYCGRKTTMQQQQQSFFPIETYLVNVTPHNEITTYNYNRIMRSNKQEYLSLSYLFAH